MTRVTAAFDPALNSPGAAVFVDGVLVVADNVRVPDELREQEMGERIDLVAGLCVAWYLGKSAAGGWRAAELVIAYEKPTLRGGGPSSVDPDDVIHIAMVASAIVGQLRYHPAREGGAKICAPTPEQWNHGSKKIKRNHPCIWEGQRGIQIASRLSPAERALVPDKHDALDAVGIGLHAEGRMEVRRVNARRRRAT